MTQVSRGSRPGVALPVRIHDLLLSLAGRLDDDALADARQMLASAELDRSLEFVAGCLAAGGIVLSDAQHRELESLFADTYLDPSVIDRIVVRDPVSVARHRFADGAVEGREPDRGVPEAVRPVLDVLPDVRSVWCVWRLTPAGPASGPVPYRVVLVGVGPGGFAPATAYRVEYALRRAGIRASVEVLVDGNQPTDYHQEAMRCARQVPFAEPSPGGRPPMTPVEPVRAEPFEQPRTEAPAHPFGGEPQGGGLPRSFGGGAVRPEPAMTEPVRAEPPRAESAPVEPPPAKSAQPLGALPPPAGLRSAEPVSTAEPPLPPRGAEPAPGPPGALPSPVGLRSVEPSGSLAPSVEPGRAESAPEPPGAVPPPVGLRGSEPRGALRPSPVGLRSVQPSGALPRAEPAVLPPPVGLRGAEPVPTADLPLPPPVELLRAESTPPSPMPRPEPAPEPAKPEAVFAQERLLDEKPDDLPESALRIETPTNSRPSPRRRANKPGEANDGPPRPVPDSPPPSDPDQHSAALVDDILNTQERHLLRELQDELARREQQEQGSTSSGPWRIDKSGRHGKPGAGPFDSARASGPTLINGVPPHPDPRGGYPPAT